MVGRKSSPSAAPPWWGGSAGRSTPPSAGLRPSLPWTTDGRAAAAAQPGVRPSGTMLRPPVPLAVGALVVVVGVVLTVVVAVRGTDGDGPVTTPFLSYTPPPGWGAAPPDPAATTDAPTLVGVVHGPRYTCGAEEFVRGFAAAALLPTDPATDPADRAERMAWWLAVTTFSAADGTPPEATVSPPRPVPVAGPDGPVDGTVTEAVIRAPGDHDGCAATAGRVLVLAVPHSGGAALLLVAGDTGGGPADPAPPDPAALDAVVDSARMS